MFVSRFEADVSWTIFNNDNSQMNANEDYEVVQDSLVQQPVVVRINR